MLRGDPIERARTRQRVAFAFDASQPVRTRDALCGRDRKLTMLLDAVLYRRNHAIVYGPRGSGKTSLARIFGDYADQEGVVVLYMSCTERSGFASLIRPYLEQLPSALDGLNRGALAEKVERLPSDFTARDVVGLLYEARQVHIVMIFDEFDRVLETETRTEIASLMKMSSDARLPVNYVLVGIAANVPEIVDAHPSLRRHMTAISIEPLADDDVRMIIESCERRSGLVFSERAKELVAAFACGSPYHARLFGMHAAFAALDRQSAMVSEQEVRDGLRAAYEEWREFNLDDARTFERIARERVTDAGQVARLARSAAYRRGLDFEHSEELAMPISGQSLTTIGLALGGAAECRNDVVVFKDSTAPQFLLVALELENGSTGSPHVLEAI